MRNFALVLVMFCALLGALGWMAFTGVGATHSNAPPVVVDLGTQAQPFHPTQPEPEVSLKSEPLPVVESPHPAPARQGEGRRIAKRTYPRYSTASIRRRSTLSLAGNSKTADAASSLGAGRKTPVRLPAKRTDSRVEAAVHIAPSVPAAEHYAPTLNAGPERGRDLPIEVRKLPDSSGPTQSSLEADREWRRQTLDRWAREESQSLGQQVKEQKPKTRAEPPKRKKRSRHRLLFISW